MKKPVLKALAFSESLHNTEIISVDNIVRQPENINNADKPPSIIPGVAYPLSGREKQIVRYVWRHAQNMSEKGLL